MTNFLPGGPVSVGRIVRCPLPSRHPLVDLLCADGGDFANVAILFPTSPFQNLYWVDAAVVWIALALPREASEMCDRAELPGRFRFLGIWTSTPPLPRDGPSRINVFCILSIC